MADKAVAPPGSEPPTIRANANRRFRASEHFGVGVGDGVDQRQRLDEGFRADLIVEGKVILELKSVEKVHPAHKKPFQSNLREALTKDDFT